MFGGNSGPVGGAVSRRESLALLAGLGGAAALGNPARAAPSAGAIDVHSHFFPPSLQEASDRALAALHGGAVPTRLQGWTPERALEAMDRNGVAKQVVNASWRPALLELGRDKLRATARSANDYAARLGQDHRGRFSQFGFLPMPDVDGSLAEIEYCLDVLKAPGIGMMTSYGNKWQGDPSFAPILQELNRRKAVVFCHPLPAVCCSNLMPDISVEEPNLIEFPYDTGRAVVGLLLSGAFAKYRDIKWIFCHCGGPLPALAGRIRTHAINVGPDRLAVIAPQGVDYELQRQFYETADAAYAPSLSALMNYVAPTQILFGSDFPYVSVDANVKELRERRLPSAAMAAIQRGNVLRVMPQLA